MNVFAPVRIWYFTQIIEQLGSQATPPHLVCGELAGSNPACSTVIVAQLVERQVVVLMVASSSLVYYLIIVLWCNGSTHVSDTFGSGSNPAKTTLMRE